MRFLLLVWTLAAATKFLPGATPLIFDADQSALSEIRVQALHTLVWHTYTHTHIQHFRRIPITISVPVTQLVQYRRDTPTGLVPPKLSLAVSVELKSSDNSNLVLLLERSRFGNGIRHDTSNFCDWLHGTDRRMSSLSITTDLINDEGKIGRATAVASEDYVLYVGFSGTEGHLHRVIDFEVAVRLEPESTADFTPACAAFERFDQAPSTVHIKRKSTIPHLSVLTKDIILRRWTDLPTSKEILGDSTPTTEAKLAKSAFAVTLQPHQIYAIGIDVPAAPEKLNQWYPTLTLVGLPAGGADVLVGSYKAQSVWELQRFEQFAVRDASFEPRTWALPLRGVIKHLQSHQGFLSPPGSSLLVLILPRTRTSLNLEGQFLLMSPEHSLSPIMVTDEPPQTFPSFYLTALQSIFFACFGIAAGAGILHAFWLVMTRLASNVEPRFMPRWVRKGMERDGIIVQARQLEFNERTPLVVHCPPVQSYDIASHPDGNGTNRSTQSSSL